MFCYMLVPLPHQQLVNSTFLHKGFDIFPWCCITFAVQYTCTCTCIWVIPYWLLCTLYKLHLLKPQNNPHKAIITQIPIFQTYLYMIYMYKWCNFMIHIFTSILMQLQFEWDDILTVGIKWVTCISENAFSHIRIYKILCIQCVIYRCITIWW